MNRVGVRIRGNKLSGAAELVERDFVTWNILFETLPDILFVQLDLQPKANLRNTPTEKVRS